MPNLRGMKEKKDAADSTHTHTIDRARTSVLDDDRRAATAAIDGRKRSPICLQKAMTTTMM